MKNLTKIAKYGSQGLGAILVIGSIIAPSSTAGYIESIPIILLGLLLFGAPWISLKNNWVKYVAIIAVFIAGELLTEAVLPKVPTPHITSSFQSEVYENPITIDFEIENLTPERLSVNNNEIDTEARSASVNLEEGENTIKIVAYSEDGRSRFDEVIVNYVSPEILETRKQEEERKKEEKGNKQREIAEEKAKSNSLEAWVCAKMEIEKYLKAPKTADFDSSGLSKTKPLGDNKYIVSSYVDSQNSFGAMLRTNFVCEIEYFPDTESCLSKCQEIE